MVHIKKSLAGLTTAFMIMATAQSANAQQQPWESGNDPWELKPGSEQYNLLKPHEDFIKKMRNCCSLRDGRANLEERINEGENPDFPPDRYPYIVIVTHDLRGDELKEPATIYIPRDRVITASEANATCKPQRILDPNSTCIPPSFNVLWMRDDSNYDGYNPNSNLPYGYFVYCYWPQPGLQ
ncbi:MAG: hypothetical protein LRY39_00325 [Alphaproteobacteria bacterium]|nr:hypothetical protein [Alphaproteobacteria bacterium]